MFFFGSDYVQASLHSYRTGNIYYIEVIIQLVLSRSFKAGFANSPLAQWARLHVGHTCDHGFDSQLPSYFWNVFTFS